MPRTRVGYVTQCKAYLPVVARCEISPSYHAELFNYDSSVTLTALNSFNPPTPHLPPISLYLLPPSATPSSLPPFFSSLSPFLPLSLLPLLPSHPFFLSPSFLYFPLTLSSSPPPSFSPFLHFLFSFPPSHIPSSLFLFLTRGLFHTTSYLSVPLRYIDWEFGGNSGSVNNSPLC